MQYPVGRAALALALGVVSAQALAAPAFSACFALEPGVSYSTGWGSLASTYTITNAQFMGEEVLAVVLSGGGTRSAAFYDPSGMAHLGNVEYGIAGWGGDPDAVVLAEVYSEPPRFPSQAEPGDRFTLSGKGERIRYADDSVEPIEYQGFAHYTFIGFEDLVLEVDSAEHQFENTCHLKAVTENGYAEMWYAPGLGRIKFQRYESGGLLFSEQIKFTVQPKGRQAG